MAAETGRDFPNLFNSSERTDAGLAERRATLQSLEHTDGVTIVLMGSWGRAEVTSGSDDDFMVLVDGSDLDGAKPSIDEVRKVLDRAPSGEGPFGAPVGCDELVDNIGLDHDDNHNLTRRMLFLLESIPATAEDFYSDARGRVLRTYLDESVKSFRPPRFLLNDIVRYWRTICVDFAGKERADSEKWGLRNAKLRTSRKILFAGGLLPVLDCAERESGEMFAFLDGEFDTPPTDRLARAFLEHGAVDEGARALGAYDEFLGLLDDESFRGELREVTRATANQSAAFGDVRRLARELEAGLLALLFETRSLPKLVRDYGIF